MLNDSTECVKTGDAQPLAVAGGLLHSHSTPASFRDLCKCENLQLQMAHMLLGLLISECDEDNSEGEKKVEVLLSFCASGLTYGEYVSSSSHASIESEVEGKATQGRMMRSYIQRLVLEDVQDAGEDANHNSSGKRKSFHSNYRLMRLQASSSAALEFFVQCNLVLRHSNEPISLHLCA